MHKRVERKGDAARASDFHDFFFFFTGDIVHLGGELVGEILDRLQPFALIVFRNVARGCELFERFIRFAPRRA